jgi:hypothetical protein
MRKYFCFTALARSEILYFVFILFFLSGIKSYSYPKFAAYTGAKCQSCHINPTGGQIRHMGGIKYAEEMLIMDMFKKYNKDASFDTRIGKVLQIGGDLRLGGFEIEGGRVDPEGGNGGAKLNTFFAMEADLYINAALGKIVDIVLNPSLQYNNYPPVYEFYGMLHNLPLDLYLKAGKIRPNFGIKLPEHRPYQKYFNFYTPYNPDAGLEIGISPGPVTITAGLFNGVPTNFYNRSGPSDFDMDNGKEFVASGDFRWAPKSKKKNFTFDIGASFLNNPFRYKVSPTSGTYDAVSQIIAGFASFGFLERIAILGEIDFNSQKYTEDSTSVKNLFNTYFAEADVKVINGLELKFQYEKIDNNLGTKNGPGERIRYSGGAVFFPLQGFELEAMYRLSKTYPDDKFYNESNVIFHFYF